MRFTLDENLPLQLKDLLTEVGHDAATVLDQGSAEQRIQMSCRSASLRTASW